MFPAMWLAMPAKHAVHVQAYATVGVGMVARDPRVGFVQFHAQFFMQFPGKGLDGTFVCFELAARKLPVAGPWFSGRAFGQQDAAVPARDDPYGDVDYVVGLQGLMFHVNEIVRFSNLSGMLEFMWLQLQRVL